MVIMSLVVLLPGGNREAQRIKVVDVVHISGVSFQKARRFFHIRAIKLLPPDSPAALLSILNPAPLISASQPVTQLCVVASCPFACLAARGALCLFQRHWLSEKQRPHNLELAEPHPSTFRTPGSNSNLHRRV